MDGRGAAETHLNAEERNRLAAVRRYDILDTPPDGAFDRVASLAARFFKTPIATVSIVDEDRIWFKAKHGIDASEIDRDPGLCASVILHDETYLVNDAIRDPRTFENPLVTGDLKLRFYAAAPLITKDGYRLGTVNVMDIRPRRIELGRLRVLQDLASIVIDELELRLAARKISQQAHAEQQLGDALQKRVLPDSLERIPGMDLAVCYHPAGAGLNISGDFYDLFAMKEGMWAAFIGDVCGKGIEAAVTMVGLHHRLRALAEVGRRPSEAIAHLNYSMRRENRSELFCSVCFLHVEPIASGARIVFCSGGHPLPLICRRNGEVEAVGSHGTLIGLFPSVELEDTEVELAPGELMVLHTDGVVERRGEDLLERERVLRRLVAGSSGSTAAEVLESIETTLIGDDATLSDDAAVIVLKVDVPA